MLSHAPGDPNAIDLASVLRTVGRKIPALIVLAASVAAITGGVLSTMAPKYLSQSQLEIRGSGPAEGGGRPDKEAVGTHVRGLMSTELALKMSKALTLTQRPEFNTALEPDDLYGRLLRTAGIGGPKPGETDEDRLMQAYFRAVRAYQVRETRSVIIDCTSSSAKFSADCANTLAELYRDSLRGRAAVENSDVRGKLAPEVDRLTRETSVAEADAAEFRGRANLFLSGMQSTGLKDQQLSELSAELTRAATTRGEADARAQTARDMSLRGSAAANPDVQKSTLIPKMEEQRVTLERQISELSATLLPGHPRMKQLHSELAGLQGQIRTEILKAVDSLGNDARIAADREAGIRRRVDDLKRTVVSSGPDTVRLAQLENQARSKRAELERVQRQFETATSSAAAAVAPAEVEIVSRAYPSNEKVFPKIGSMASLAAAAAFILGLALVLTRELVRSARPEAKRPSHAHTTVGLGEAAPNRRALSGDAMAASKRAGTQTSDGIADTAHKLVEIARGARGFRVLVASHEAPGNRPSLVMELAHSLAATGKKVLLIAWAGSGATLAGLINVDNEPGTSNLLRGTVSLEEAIQRAPNGSIDILGSGSSPTEAIDPDSAAMLLDALDEMYDVIVVYAPHAIAQALFEMIHGRFDAGVLVVASSELSLPPSNQSFLGFLVPDFPILRIASAPSDSWRAASAPSARGPARASL